MLWLIASALIITSTGLSLLSQGTQTSIELERILANPKRAHLVLSEDFSDPTALQRFQSSEPDLGFKAGEKGRAAWRIDHGRLIGEKAHNATLWLKEMIPADQFVITFTARALTKEGDVKCELSGDGKLHQSGYILINGGWSNSLRVIARQDEHGEDRREDRRCDRKRKCAPKDQDMRWLIERRGDLIQWYLDGRLILRHVDPNPLSGRSFGFGNWSASVEFDDLKVYQLKP